MRVAEYWSEHKKRLQALFVGDCLRIQNQTGHLPNKWDKTGSVVEVCQFDQYVIRVDGSGRMTLKNRKFLRKYVPVIPQSTKTSTEGYLFKIDFNLLSSSSLGILRFVCVLKCMYNYKNNVLRQNICSVIYGL